MGDLAVQDRRQAGVTRTVCYSPALTNQRSIRLGDVACIGRELLILNHFVLVLRIWLVAVVACSAVVAPIFLWVDVPAARHFWNADHLGSPMNVLFGSTVILAAESAVVLSAVLARLLKGRISVFGETLAIACLVSMCAYAVNDHVLKVVFGVPSTAEVVRGASHAMNLWKGSLGSSFPSGHMVLAGAFAGVFMRLHRTTVWLLSGLLLIAAACLLVGDWHFLSDIVAGAFVGVSAGVLAGEGWVAHLARQWSSGRAS